MTKIFIDGKEGTTGLKIYERFENRNDIELLQIPEEYRKDSNARAEFINNSDITFLCLPDVAAIEAVNLVENDKVKIIDASTVHRTLPEWAYGFPELDRTFHDRILLSSRVAVPGCHASGFLSIVYPLVMHGIMPCDYPVVCHSVTGFSGGGKGMIAEYVDENKSTDYSAPRQYGLLQSHKHQKEMKEIAGLTQIPIFNPIVANFERGMEVSIPLYCNRLVGGSARHIHDALSQHYAGQKMIKVMPLGSEKEYKGFLPSNLLAGKNTMQIYVFGNDERVLVCSLFDNLGKGASGAAVQCMNIMLGLEETTGLI